MIVFGLVAFAISQIVVGGFIFGAVAAGAAAERRAEQNRQPGAHPVHSEASRTTGGPFDSGMASHDGDTEVVERYANTPHHPAWGPARHVEGRVR